MNYEDYIFVGLGCWMVLFILCWWACCGRPKKTIHLSPDLKKRMKEDLQKEMLRDIGLDHLENQVKKLKRRDTE